MLAQRAGIVLGAIVAAYHASLLTLVRNFTASTPLAYLALVPFIALGLAVIAWRRRRWEPDIHDRYIDYIVGLPLIVATLAIVLIGPVLLSSFYWRWRIDLLTLPIFAAGALTLVFGLRTAIRLKFALAFLFLAWPIPYTILLGDWTTAFSDATNGALTHLVGVLPLARPVEDSDGSLFMIQNASQPFVVSVGSACAGVNGALGFLLAGGALAGVARGHFAAKLGWLISGLALTWAFNVLRIMVIFGAGAAQGQDFAIDALHPLFGLVTFNVGIAVAALALPLFRLRISNPAATYRRPESTQAVDEPTVFAARAAPLAVRRGAVAIALVIAASVIVASANADRRHELVVADLGQPRLYGFDAQVPTVDGWTASLTNNYPWVRQYFGEGATWDRYIYLPNRANGTGMPPYYITIDVVTTLDLSTFSAYGLEACYGFHNYRVLEKERVDFGAGVVGKSIIYYNAATRLDWTAVYWEWPIQTASGEQYERIVLNATPTAAVNPPATPAAGGFFDRLQLAIASLLDGDSGQVTDPQLIATREMLRAFARSVISSRTQSAVVGPTL